MRQIVIRRAAIGALAHHWALRALVGLTGMVLLSLLATYHQPYYPVVWLDEGFLLQGPINLVRFGKYAMRSVEGFRILDQPLIANGPGIVLPIAAAFALFGIGLLQARMVMAIYLTLTASVFFALAKRMYGTPAAAISLFLLLAVPREGFSWFGRMTMGNVPALGYFVIGCLLWLDSVERDSAWYALGAGLWFGLAMVTKGQYGLIVPALLVVAFVDKVCYREIGLKKVALALLTAIGCLGLWYVVQLALVGWEDFDQHLNAVRASSCVTVFAFRPLRSLGSLWYLVRSGLPLFVIPGLLYAGWSLRNRDLGSCQRLLPIVFVVIWLCWYAFVSVGWHRYAFAPYAIGLLFAGKFVVDATSFVSGGNRIPTAGRREMICVRAGTLLLVTAILVGGIGGFTQRVRSIVAKPDMSLQRFAHYIRDNVSPQVVIESGDWQVDVVTEHIYHHPTNDWVDRFTSVLQFGEDIEVTYDPFECQPDYLIDGPWSKWMGLYTPHLADGCCTLEVSIGSYDLYRVNAQRLQQ
jgi:hypothetical protein